VQRETDFSHDADVEQLADALLTDLTTHRRPLLG